MSGAGDGRSADLMLLTITSTHPPATDLGYLLHKHPSRTQSFPLSFGTAHVFYPEASAERCTAALLLDIDPVGLVRERRGPAGQGRALEEYVNDRPYVASSFLSVAIAQVLGSALQGRSKERQPLADAELSLEAGLSALPCRGGEGFLRRLLEPLGYAVSAESLPLDEAFPQWGASRYLRVRLQGRLRLRDLLSHLYVWMPVLDDEGSSRDATCGSPMAWRSRWRSSSAPPRASASAWRRSSTSW